jgi:hypothetical protein
VTFDSLAELIHFAPDTYGLRWRNHVSVFVTTPEGVVVIDPCGQGNPRTPSLVREAIRSITPDSVRYVVYSHAALDHAQGGQVFKDTDGALFISTQRTADHLRTVNEPTTPLPDETFDVRRRLQMGPTAIDLHASYMTPNENYLYVHHPASRWLMYVDFIQPDSIPLRLHGHPSVAIERIEHLLTLDFDFVISGHATPRTTTPRGELGLQIDYYRDLMDGIASARAKGMFDDSPALKDAVREQLRPRWGGWRRFDECLDTNIQNAIDFEFGRWLPPH